MEIIKKIHEKIKEPPPYLNYNEWTIYLDDVCHEFGYSLVHVEDATIGIRRKGCKDYVIVFPGSDISYGQEVIERMAGDHLTVIDHVNDLKYVTVKVNGDFPFVVSDPHESLSCNHSPDNPLICFFANKYPSEYVDKVFGYTADLQNIVNSIITSLGKA